jgi:hypothetical protein
MVEMRGPQLAPPAVGKILGQRLRGEFSAGIFSVGINNLKMPQFMENCAFYGRIGGLKYNQDKIKSLGVIEKIWIWAGEDERN